MKAFNHVDAKSVADAAAALAGGKAVLIAGGTDLLGRLKDDILPTYPEMLVNVKTIPNLDYLYAQDGGIKIGAATRLADIAANLALQNDYTALAQAAARVATPHVRDMGTIGGNITQLHRCWYFRSAGNRFNCLRKGGTTCFAVAGDNRYHSIFGAVNGCFAVNPSDLAPALIALDAKIVTNKRTLAAQDFWDVKLPGNTVLAVDEIVTEVQLPPPGKGAQSTFYKFAIRKSIDFAIVNCAVSTTGTSARIVLNGVAPKPYRATKAEAAIAGKPINDANADAAGAAAVADAAPLPGSKYKVQIARTLVKRALLAVAPKT